MSIANSIHPATWEAFWTHIAEGKVARFGEKIGRVKIVESSHAGWFFLDFDHDLPGGGVDGLDYQYTRKMLQSWLEDNFQPNDWEINNE